MERIVEALRSVSSGRKGDRRSSRGDENNAVEKDNNNTIVSAWSLESLVQSALAPNPNPTPGAPTTAGVLLGPSRLNLLRLILTWTAEGNVLKQKKKTVKSPAECYTVPVFMQPELTLDHVTSLLPKSIPWHLESHGRRVYDAKVSVGRKTDTVQSLIQALVTAAPSAPLVWLVQQPPMANPSGDEKSKGGKEKKKKGKKGDVDDDRDDGLDDNEAGGDGTFAVFAVQASANDDTINQARWGPSDYSIAFYSSFFLLYVCHLLLVTNYG